MKHCLYAMLIITMFASCGPTKGIQVHEVKQNTTALQLNKILILGRGPSPTRLFLEKFSTELHNAFWDVKVESEYLFLGTSAETVKATIDKNSHRNDFDAILEILPASDAEVRRPAGDFSSPIVKEGFKQKFVLIVYAGDEKEARWKADMNVYINSTGSKTYKQASEKIISLFKLNRLIGG